MVPQKNARYIMDITHVQQVSIRMSQYDKKTVRQNKEKAGGINQTCVTKEGNGASPADRQD